MSLIAGRQISGSVASASYAQTASFALNSSGITIDTGSFAITGSNTFNGNQTINGRTIITGSLQVTGSVNIPSITGSLQGTSSYATQAISSSFAATASYVVLTQTASYAQNAQTASYVFQAVSASYATTASYVANASSFPYTGNAIITGSLIITGSTISTLGFTGSLFGTSTTASYVQQAVSSSFATSANTASYVTTAQTASYVLQAVSASYALTASYAVNASSTPTFPYSGSAIITGSLLISGSGLTVIGNQIISGSITFASGARITSTYYGNAYPGYIDIVAGAPGGFVELLSYNQSSSVNVDDFSVYITTNSSSLFNLWEFKNNGRLVAPRGIEATSFTGSLQGTASYTNQSLSSSYALTASLAPNYVLTIATSSMSVATASYVLQAVSSSYSTTSSYALQALTASYASTYAPVFPFTGSAIISGSLVVTGSIFTPLVNGASTASGTLTLASTSNATKGKILFGTSAYDEVNNRLGLGTTSPAFDFDLIKSVPASYVGANIQNTNATGYSFIEVLGDNNTTYSSLNAFNTAGGVGTFYDNNTAGVATNSPTLSFLTNENATGGWVLTAGGYGSGSEKARFTINATSFKQAVTASGAITQFTFTNAANTNQTLSTNIPNFKITGANKQWATGTLATQYFNYFSANTVSFVGASTATNVYGLYVEASTAGTNATITNNYGMGINGGLILTPIASQTGLVINGQTNSATGITLFKIINSAGYTAFTIDDSNLIAKFYGGGGIANASISSTADATVGIGQATKQISFITDSAVRFKVTGATSSGAVPRFLFTPANQTGITASTETPTLQQDSSTQTYATGAVTNHRDWWLKTTTLAAAAASTFTNVYGLYVEAPTAGTNATITNNYAAGFSGSVQILTGGLNVTGSLNVTGGITGSLLGTASFITGSIFTNGNLALSASNSQTASYVFQAVSASYATTASYYSGSVISASYAISSSQSQNSISASYSITASYASTYAPVFPYTGNAIITGSLVVTGSIRALVTGSDFVNIGNAVTASQRLVRIGQDTAWIDIGSQSGSTARAAIYLNTTTPDTTNYSLSAHQTVGNTYLNGKSGIQLLINGNILHTFDINTVTFAPTLKNGGSNTPFTFTCGADLNQVASTNAPYFKITGSTKTFLTGTLTTQYFNYFSSNTLAFTGASTATNVYGLYVEAATAGTNATITNNYAAGFSGSVRILNGNLTVTGSVNASSFTGSLFGTSSWATNATLASTASYVAGANVVGAVTDSNGLGGLNAGSYALTSSLTNYALSTSTTGFATTGSNTFAGNQSVTGNVNITGSLSILGTINADTGGITGSFKGDGTGLTGITAAFPNTSVSDLTSSDQFYINDGASKYITYGDLLTDLAGTNLVVESTDSLALSSNVTGLNSVVSTTLSGSYVEASTYTNIGNVSKTFANEGTFAPGTNSVITADFSAYTHHAIFVKYVLWSIGPPVMQNYANMRAGTLMAVRNNAGSSFNITDTKSQDIGDTSTIGFTITASATNTEIIMDTSAVSTNTVIKFEYTLL